MPPFIRIAPETRNVTQPGASSPGHRDSAFPSDNLPSPLNPTPIPSGGSFAPLDASRSPVVPALPPAPFQPIWLLHVGLVLLLLLLLGASFGHYHYKRKAGRRHSFLAARQQHARILLPRQSVDLRASIDSQIKSVQCHGPTCEGRLQSIREDSEARDPLLGGASVDGRRHSSKAIAMRERGQRCSLDGRYEAT